MRAKKRVCKFPLCGEPSRTWGYCVKHYSRAKRHGHANPTAQAWHGRCGTPEHISWRAMRRRCLDPNDKNYSLYGGRGVSISEEWVGDFLAFYRDMGPKPTNKHSLDRIDVNGNYCKENCRWATQFQQTQNTRRNNMIQFRGETLCLREWSRRLDIPAMRIYRRVTLRGWTLDDVLAELGRDYQN